MTDRSKISELIERSSLGTAGARSLRGRTPPEVAQRILDRAAEHECTTTPVTTNATDSVADLLLGIGDGDPAAWDEILRRYGEPVSATVRSFRLQDADALDAVQMTWLQLMTNWHRVRDPERLGGWLASTARRECLAIIRRSKRTAYRAEAPIDAVAVVSADPEQGVLAAETVLALRSLGGELTLRGQTLLQALFSDNPLPYAEIARVTDTPVGSMGPTRARALEQLRRRLDECLLMATGHQPM